jgi:glycosyltransferase involved in cell wall biosynthesis
MQGDKNLTDVGVVVSTIGNSESLEALLNSISKQSYPAKQVVIVDQSEHDNVLSLARKYDFMHLRTPRGLSIGRNAGLAALRGCAFVAFPDDDCEYPLDTFERLVTLFAQTGAAALSGRLDSDGTQRVAFTSKRQTLDKKSVWNRSIEPATFYRYSTLQEVGSFDETLGIGASTRWQSGEGTDLLIRVMNCGYTVVYDPDLVVHEHVQEVRPQDHLHKVRRYARGTGRVYAKWYSVGDKSLLIIKP